MRPMTVMCLAAVVAVPIITLAAHAADDGPYRVLRVVKAGGRLIFVEHGRAPDPGVVVWQDRLTPLWKRMCGGCHLNRRIDEMIKEAGFQIPELTTSYLPGPRPMTYTYQGVAQPIL